MSASSSLSSRNQPTLRIPNELHAALARHQRERHDYFEKPRRCLTCYPDRRRIELGCATNSRSQELCLCAFCSPLALMHAER